jgi:glycosyltransferase involved in cell wall biosynthesis
MNLAFCLWLLDRRIRSGDRVEIMVHEPFLAFGEGSLRQNAPALVHRLMTITLLGAADRVWVSIPEWERRWKPYALGRRIPFHWLPIPSNIPIAEDNGATQDVRRKLAANGAFLIGHFGTYGQAVASVLEPVLLNLENDLSGPVLLMGIGSEAFRSRIIRKKQKLASRLFATGTLSPAELSCHVAACDLLIQPYPDGVSSRRTSFMAGLAHGKPIVTNTGRLTESLWADTQAVALAPRADADAFIRLLTQLRADDSTRIRMGFAARKLYKERFDISHTIAALQDGHLNYWCVS